MSPDELRAHIDQACHEHDKFMREQARPAQAPVQKSGPGDVVIYREHVNGADVPDYAAEPPSEDELMAAPVTGALLVETIAQLQIELDDAIARELRGLREELRAKIKQLELELDELKTELRNLPPARSPRMRGTFNPNTEYGQLDVVALNGSSFIALRDVPGACPGANWQLVASCGRRGSKGKRGERGRAAASIASWRIDRSSYVATPILSDGSAGAPLQLRELFHRGHVDIEREVLIESFGEALGMARNKLLDQIEPQLQKINALELKLAELTGTIDVLRGLQPPPPAKFPTIRVWSEDTIYHEGDIVAFAGGTWQALRDTARAPGAQDWVCLATPGNSLTVRGTYDGDGDYRCLDVTMVNGSSFIALRDRPGPCPSSDWQLLASRGSRGDRGPKGERGLTGPRGECGAAAPTIRTWEVERASYAATPIMSDGSKGPPLELRTLFEQFLSERGE